MVSALQLLFNFLKRRFGLSAELDPNHITVVRLMRCNMMSLSGFLGVQVDVLIDEAAAAELERYDEVQQRAPARKGESRSHTLWQESEG